VDSIHLNENDHKSVAVFSLSSSSSSSSLNEPIKTSLLMSTRILPANNYYDQDQTTSTNLNEKNSTSSSLMKCFNTYREQIPFTSSCSSSASSTSSTSSSSSTNPSTKKDFLPGHSLETLTIEQNLFNMVRFDIIKSNFCDYYQLGNFVRSGGFSDIHEGIRLSDNKQVVVKFIPKEKTKNWLMISQKRYPAEILLHKAVHEIQGVIHVYDYFENADHWILVMERLHNCQDLFDYLESSERGRLNEITARKFFRQLIQINLALLRKGVVHRDLKSENILVDLDTESLILIDFGASAIYKSSSSYYSDFHGTKQYKSPEYIIRKRYAGVPSTVWTLGVLLYDMVCGSLPFENEEEITGHKLVLKSHLSAELKNLIQRCLAQNPDRRPSLESILEHAWFKN
jgi:tRNA A-37 threonylcarbamoyl transferase component Bud32